MHATGSESGIPHNASLIEWIIRIAVAGCFIGHGAFGFITKASWIPFFEAVGIPADLSWKLMPVIGVMDVAIGVLALILPTRGLLYWAIIWTTWTALLRPLSGNSWFEFLERAGNYGVPLAWLTAIGFSGPLMSRLTDSWKSLDARTWDRVAWILRLSVVALLAGHAGFGLVMQKDMLAGQYALFAGEASHTVLLAVGAFEFLLAGLVLLRPFPSLLIGVCLWKVMTEALYPISGAPFWEFIERFGSYGAPVALAMILARKTERAPSSATATAN